MALYSTIQAEDYNKLINMNSDDVDKKFLVYLFVNQKQDNGKIDCRYLTSTPLTIQKGNYKKLNTVQISTTLGIFIFNKLFIEESFYPILGYINDTITGSRLEDIDTKLSQALLNDRITSDQFIKYMNKLQFYSFTMASLLTPSLSINIIEENKKVRKRKDELFKENKEALDNGDVITSVKIEQELLSIAKEELKDDPAMDLFNSGSKASFGNNYKNIAIMGGAKLDPGTGKYVITKSNFIEGTNKDDIEALGNSITFGAYSKGVGTQVGGYLTKKYLASYQTLVLDKKKSDCGSVRYKEFIITKSNYKLFLYRYILSGEKIILMDDDNIEKYIGKVVKMRSPLYCTTEKICNVCAGEIFYKLGIENIGLTTTKVSSTLMNKSLKKFHDVSLKLHKIDLKDISF